ncbi:MAG TPA: hypothetical protein VLB45_06620 [Nitrosopumilaceae archaeon]|nr:hypothetical protein [Nitrosopumilaceae archaeon]
MLSKRTAIGIGAGSVITALGVISLILAFGVQTQTIDESVDIGKNTIYKFNAQEHFHEILNVTGTSFHVQLKTPSTGLQVDQDFKNEVSFEWYSLEDGEHRIEVTNTGDSQLHVFGTLQFTSDPILFTYHMLVIISGVIIIGISAGFTIRKPRGF